MGILHNIGYGFSFILLLGSLIILITLGIFIQKTNKFKKENEEVMEKVNEEKLVKVTATTDGDPYDCDSGPDKILFTGESKWCKQKVNYSYKDVTYNDKVVTRVTWSGAVCGNTVVIAIDPAHPDTPVAAIDWYTSELMDAKQRSAILAVVLSILVLLTSISGFIYVYKKKNARD